MYMITHLKNILTLSDYLLIYQPFEEVVRERRSIFYKKEKKYVLPKGTMAHFWLKITNYKHIKFKNQFIGIFAGKTNSYLSFFYKARFFYLIKGKIKYTSHNSN